MASTSAEDTPSVPHKADTPSVPVPHEADTPSVPVPHEADTPSVPVPHEADTPAVPPSIEVQTPTTNYPSEVEAAIRKEREQPAPNEDDRLHQQLAVAYMTQIQRNGRGILVYHATGTGKTRLAVRIAQWYREREPSRSIIFLMPKSLQYNAQKTIEELDPGNNDAYRFVSLNASNTFDRVAAPEVYYIEKSLGKFISFRKSIENSLVIIDEFHNFSNAVTNGSKNAVRLYDLFMRTKDIRFVFLTGTPMINHPYELVPTFNILRGPIHIGNARGDASGNARGKGKRGQEKPSTMFPEYRQDFESFFVDRELNKPKNEAHFMNRIYGLVSYFGLDKTQPSQPLAQQAMDFPEELPLEIVECPMGEYQYGQYSMFRDIELREESSRQRRKVEPEPFSKQNSGGMSSYRIRSRQASNFALPEHAIVIEKNKVVKKTEKLTAKDFNPKWSCKYEALLRNLEKHKGTVGLIYSEFLTLGIRVIAGILQKKGFTEFNSSVAGASKASQCYAIISGEISEQHRKEIIDAMVSSENMHGERIAVLIISKTGAEGLDLKYIRHIHIMEPYWNYARIAQIIARGVRYKSHELLPTEERNVKSYIYIATAPVSGTKQESKPLAKNAKQAKPLAKQAKPLAKQAKSTDEDIFESSVKNMNLIQQFQELLIRASFDCAVHSPDKDCMKCFPNKKLMYAAIDTDMQAPSPCQVPTESEIKVQEIVVSTPQGEKTFFYRKDAFDLEVFRFDEHLQHYIQLDISDPMYAAIRDSLSGHTSTRASEQL
jgi:superfamily II DNA or RNA helicase